jgi:thiol-disulfide isomerase/thioredoxin
MTGSFDAARAQAKKRLVAIVAGGVAGVAVGLAGVYGIGLWLGNRAIDPACRPTIETAQRITPFIRGEVAALAPARRPIRVPDLAFLDGAGSQVHLSAWHGRTVLLNLWATWCVPCRQEMPALDDLQGQLGSSEFEVVAINIDTRDAEKPRAWLKEVGIDRLAYFADPSAKVFQDLKQAGKAYGMPTTLLIDPAGCEIATLAGPADWASADAVRLVSAALGRAVN